VDASLFRPAGPADKQHSPSACGEGDAGGPEVTVVALSRLVYRKGIDLLAAVLPELCRRHPRVHFLIGGDGPKRATLERAVAAAGLQARVTLVGAVPPDRVRDLLVQGAVFLNCSLTEAFCMALVEAAAAGLLVVSTAVGGVPEVLPAGMVELAEPSPEGLVAAVGRALARVGGGGVDAAAQHARVAAMYSWAGVAARTEAVYRAAAGSARDDGPAARLRRYHACGRWFGKICCCVAAVDWLYWRWLEWWEPGESIATVPDFPSPFGEQPHAR
jgi:phosphatidylinositol glycan class A protein